MEISLEQLLLSRDRRAEKQRELLDKFHNNTLICLTVVMAGKVKRTPESVFVGQQALAQLEEIFNKNILHQETHDLDTGFEAYFVTDIEPFRAKQLCCEIEEKHPLGRLFDVDVIGKDGVPMTRTMVGYDPRKCLICNEEARYCMRNFTHSQQEIQEKIHQIITQYKPLNQKHFLMTDLG